MGRLVISLNGQIIVRWYRKSSTGIDKFGQKFRRIARREEVTPDELAELAIIHKARGATLYADEAALDRDSLIYYALQQPTSDPQHPGSIGEHLPAYDFEIGITVDFTAKKIHVNGQVQRRPTSRQEGH